MFWVWKNRTRSDKFSFRPGLSAMPAERAWGLGILPTLGRGLSAIAEVGEGILECLRLGGGSGR